MTPDERAVLIAWVKQRTSDSLDDIRQGRITLQEANRRTSAAKVILRCIRDEDDIADVRAQLESIFPK
jgi:hypothetical protein